MNDAGPPGHVPEAMLYDWFKHLTSLSLLTLGRVLSLSQVAEASEIKSTNLIIVLVLVSPAGSWRSVPPTNSSTAGCAGSLCLGKRNGCSEPPPPS